MFGVAAPRELIAWVEEADVGGFNLAACLLRPNPSAANMSNDDVDISVTDELAAADAAVISDGLRAFM